MLHHFRVSFSLTIFNRTLHCLLDHDMDSVIETVTFELTTFGLVPQPSLAAEY